MKTVGHSNLLMQECYYSVAINKGSWKCYMYHMIISTDNKLKWVHKPGINDVSSDEKIYCLLSKPCWVVLYVKQVKKFELCIPFLSLLFLNHVHDELSTRFDLCNAGNVITNHWGAKFAEDVSHITNNDFFIKMLKVYKISDLKNELLPKWFY